MTLRYRHEIDKMKGIHIDAAFVPLDPRQGEHYKDGLLYFLENIDCGTVYPMHYWNKPDVIVQFIAEHPEYKTKIKNTQLTKGEDL